MQPLSPEWEQLAAGLPFNRRVRLLPLLRFLSSRGVGPQELNLLDLEAYRDAIASDRLRKDPEKTWDSLVWSWNAGRREVKGWPDIEVPRETRREVYVLAWSAFPPSLKADVDAFLLRLSGADLSENGPPRPARPATLKTREYQLRVAASALVHKGVEASEIRALADLVTLDRFKLVMRFLLDRRGGQTSPQIGQLANFLTGVARHWVEVDDLALLQLRKLGSRLSTGRRGMTAKNRERLRPFEDPQTVSAFLGLPERIRREVDKNPRAPKLKAVDAQMAAAIALLQIGSPAARQSHHNRPAPESDRPRQAGLPGVWRRRCEEPRADRLRTPGVNDRDRRLVHPRLSAPSRSRANRRPVSRGRAPVRSQPKALGRRSRRRCSGSPGLRSTRICSDTPERKSSSTAGRVNTR